ncbi:leucine rich repeat domain containing protein [Acanthamoeba castellanii str. Neff]|uniref:Leucine rich repeat domain containing protein n=1 Tax=Acanthamoeba castellanii (strain ATCC 30010 / Neff) TaxID=1257118 RepID=L8HDQ0_ACACF|nr:leucine rich repeat domain containing protein [Acanthamoeba castellanii str. Neff]ELR22516.1 leucine rich repeat domain containing protein [Acanthamoeba castellanii str. Neff]
MDHNTAKQKRDASDTLPVEMWAEVVGWLHRDCIQQPHPTGHSGAHARGGDGGAADRNFLLRSVALVSPLWRALVMSTVRTLTVRVPDDEDGFLGREQELREERPDEIQSRLGTLLQALDSVAQLCTSIEELRIDGCGFDFIGHPTLLARLPSRPSFRRLTLENLQLTDAHFGHLAPATARGLESLKIAFCTGLVDFLSIIDAKLSIAGHQSASTTAKNESDGDAAKTKSEASLGMELESERMKEDNEERDEVDLMENEAVKEKESEAKNEDDSTKNEELTRLKELVLVHCPELASLEHLPRGLERLSLQSCYRVGDREVLQIARLPRLKYLLLSVDRLITDAGLAALPLESLTEFHFHYWGMGISHRGISEARRRCKHICCVGTACPMMRDEP